MMDLSKGFDCISHELLIAKLYAYGFGKKSLKLMYCYLNNRKQRVKINSTYSSWEGHSNWRSTRVCSRTITLQLIYK